MPSLRALEEFKSSFSRIGREAETLAEQDLPVDDLPLPEHEPAEAPSPGEGSTDMFQADSGQPFQEPPETGGDPDTDFVNFGDLGDFLGGMDNQLPDISGEADFPEAPNGETEVPSQEDIDFSSFIDTIPDDLDTPADSGTASTGDFNPDNFNPGEETIPSDGAGSVSDDLELPGDFPAGDLELPADDFDLPVEADADSTDDFDLPTDDLALSTDDFDLPADDFGLPSGDPDLPAEADTTVMDDSGLPAELLDGFADEIEAERASGDTDTGSLTEIADETIAGDDSGALDLDDFPSFDAGEAIELASEEAFSDTGGSTGPESGEDAGAPSDFSLPEEISDFENAETGEAGFEAPVPSGDAAADDSAIDLSAEEDSFDLGGEISDFDNGAVLEEVPGDSFDNFKLDAAITEDFDVGGEDLGGFKDDFANLEEFSLSGIDSPADQQTAGAKADPGAARGRGRNLGPEADEVEEISLSETELEQLQATLSSYPLNLRIACEELISEQAVAPDEMSALIKLLINGAPARETANLAGKILDRTISIPRGFEKKTGEALEAEQASFAYIFVHNFLPVLKLFMMIAMALFSVGYLSWRFIYTPLRAEKIYKLGYERVEAGEYARANERFTEAFRIHEKKAWFYRYAQAFREARQYTLAEEKYQELLDYTASRNKRRIPEKAAVLEFADMETNAIGNYEKADQILRRNILDYYPADREALLALGDNSLAWGEYEPSRLEDARESYARLMERYGRTDPLLERMLKYFIRTDDLEEVLALQSYFMGSAKRKVSSAALAELGGYLLDKRFEEVRGVPNEYLDRIGGIREILLRAIEQEQTLPESYYHLARYYKNFENTADEKRTLEVAARAFEAAREESPKRIRYHIDTLRRYGEVLIGGREFIPAEENLVKGIALYEDGLSRRLLSRSPEFGRLYADLGDLEYFTKDGNMRDALDYYRRGEESGWNPPEVQYRMGAAHYQLREWGPAQDRLFTAYRETSPNRRILHALGNVSYMRGNYFAAQGYYDRLLEILDADRDRFPPIEPSRDEERIDLAERLMVVQNNMAVTLEALTERTGDNSYRSRAHGLYTDSERAWDILTRNPDSMMRMRPSPDINAPGVNPAYLNVRNSLYPVPGYEPMFFIRIDRDINEPSVWEELAPAGYYLSGGIRAGR